MACLARRIVYWYVRRRHSGCLHTVVTGGASGGDSIVVEEGAGPTEGGMTGVAFQVGIDVLWTFTLRLDIVVAS